MSGIPQMNYRIALVLILAFVVIPVMAGADVYIHPPAVISTPGTYVLQSGTTVPSGPAILIQSDDVVLDGSSFTLSGTGPGSGPGIVVDVGRNRVHIKDVTVTNFDQGILYLFAGDGLVENCVVQNNGMGISLWVSNNIHVLNNEVGSNSIFGIASQFGADNSIDENAVSGNPTGIYSFSSLRENIIDNQVTGNNVYGVWYLGIDGIIDRNDISTNGDSGIVIISSDDVSVSDNEVHANPGTGIGFDSGIYVWNSPFLPHAIDQTGLTIQNNSVEQNWYGIRLQGGSHDNTVLDNSVNANTDKGIELRGIATAYNLITDNNLANNIEYGINLMGSPLNTISNNKVISDKRGIVLSIDLGLNSNNNLIQNNTLLQNNQEGILVEGVSAVSRTTGNTLDSNTVKASAEGIILKFAQGNILTDNVVIGNTVDGLWLESSQFNTIYNNCFNNSVNVAFDPLTILPNNWNTLIAPGPNIVGGMYFGGNYWAKPDGTGHSQVTPPNADEFSNAALSIAAGNTDNFPLWSPLNASFTYTPPAGNAPVTVQFTDTSDGNPTCWYWELDDDGIIDSTEQNPIFTYTEEGIYNITLTVSRCEVEGCANSSTLVDPIVVGPHAFFKAHPLVGPVPLTVSFTDLSTPTVTSWSWQYRLNGTIPWTQFSTDQNPLFEFLTPGIYDIRLDVTGIVGPNSFERYNYIDVRVPFGPVADFTASPQSGDAPLEVNFIDLSTGDPTSWAWDFDDGSPVDNSRNPSHTFTIPGTYTVELTVTSTGGSDSKTLDIDVNVPGLMADFTASPQSGDVPLTVNFIDLSTGNITSYAWDFDDGSPIDTSRNPTHTFSTAGDYTVELTVTDAYGSDAKTLLINVNTPQPVADFIASPRTGYTPLEVFFYDQSTGAADDATYFWDFGDGYTSTDRDPVHTYTYEDSFDVIHTVTNPGPDPKEDAIEKEDYIVVSDEPIPVASILPHHFWLLTGDVPFTVDFEGMSTYSPTTWLWNFGDGLSANQQNVLHTFQEPGVYHVTLRVFDVEGRGTQDTVVVIVRPVADFEAEPESGNAPLEVQFTDTSSGNPDEFFWNFHGGFWPESTEQNPVHTFQFPGTYYVNHWVIADGVWSLIATEPVVVGDTPAIIAHPAWGEVPLGVNFEGIAGGYPVDWLWEFGDGHYQHGQTAFHTYEDTGIYTVKLTAYYSHHDPVNTTTLIEVRPDADFTMSADTGHAPLTIQFTDTSEGTISSWHWFASDGWTSTDQSPSHTFTQSGTYIVFLTVETPEGLTDHTAQFVSVFPDADFTWYPSQGEEPLTVQFVDTSLGGGFMSTWDFGDGTNATFWDSPGRSAPVHVYEELGTYTVSLTRVGFDNLPDTETKEVNLMERPPVADFTGSPRAGSAPLTVDFTDLSSGEPEGWNWEFGDGYTSALKNPSHTYAANGDYTVMLTVTNDGGSDTETKVAYIRVSSVPLPVADFTGSPVDGIEDLTVQFLDTSINSPTSWQWEFGDGGTSTLQSPLHTYTTPGHYDVMLTVSNAQGQNSIIKSDYIYVRNTPPVAAFTATPLSGDEPLSVKFTDESIGNGISSWHWDFGDGGTSAIESPIYVYNDAGTYTVALTVANDGGSDSEVKTDYITVNPAPPVPPADVIQLYPGWNFVSVPKRLASGHDTAIEVFGDVDLGGHAVLMWDASTDMWKQVTASTVLKPLDGIWIYSVTRMDVNLTFDTVNPPSPVSKQLYTGWNSIGYAGTTSMSARDFLTLSGGLNGNWITVLGYHDGMIPDLPIIRDSINPLYSDNRPMYPTHGYWISMDTDDVLQVVV